MRNFNENTDLLGLEQLNTDIKSKILEVVNFISDESNKVTQEEKDRWNNKIDIFTGPKATQTQPGLMSAEDKLKLDNVAELANFYVHPSSGVAPGQYTRVTVDSNGHVVDGAYETSFGDAASLGGVEANKYALLLSPIFQGNPTLTNTPMDSDLDSVANVKFVRQYLDAIMSTTFNFTEQDIAKWNAKWDDSNAPLVSQETSGIMSPEDKTYLDNLKVKKILTQEEYDNLLSKFGADNLVVATEEATGLMSAEDKALLNKLTPASTITVENIQSWNNIAGGSVATTEANGLMSAADKTKLDGLISISQESINSWDAIAQGAEATTQAKGLMSAADKAKLDAVPTITQEDINSWNNKSEQINIATDQSNGLMSATDKAKLDALAMSGNDEKIAQLAAWVESKGNATTEADGFMSKEDKAKVDNLDNVLDTKVNKSEIFNNGYFQTKYNHDDNSYAMLWNESDGGGALFFNNTLKVKSFVGVNQGANAEDIEAQIYSINPESKIGVRLNVNNQKGMYYLKGTTNIGMPEGRELAVKEDITNALKTELFNNNKGYFETTYTQANGSYAKIWNEDDGGGSQFFNQPRNIISYVGTNQSTTSDDIDVQIYAKDKTTNIGTRINFNTTGAFYTKNSKAIGNPAGRELAVQEDITNALNDYSTTADMNTAIDDKIKTSIFNNNKGYFETTYTHQDGSYAKIWNEDDGGGSQFYNQPRNIICYVGTNQSTDGDDIDVQIYAKNKTSNVGTRVNFNTTGAYYTKNTTAIGNPAGREIAVKEDLDALVQTINALEARITALES